jgi:LysM repeat protein
LRSWNNLPNDNLSIGRRLIVQRRAIPVPAQQIQVAQTSTAISGNTQTINQYYRVRSGDTLGAIAGQHGTTVAQIQQWNGMSNTQLAVNRQLIVGQQITQIEVPGGEPAQERSTPENITNESSRIISNFIRAQIEEAAEESEENEYDEEEYFSEEEIEMHSEEGI